MNKYIKWLRSKIGSEKIIYPGARIIIENQNKEILIIERTDNGKKGLPAGSLEENETIEECIIREVKEETGLKILDLVVIGISSNPHNESVVYPNGDKIQYFTIEFYSNNWEGVIKVEDESEVRCAKFLGPEIINQLPENERSTFDSLEYYRKRKKIMLK